MSGYGGDDGYVRQRQNFDGRAVRGRIQRRYVDYRSIFLQMVENRFYERDFRDRIRLQPHDSYTSYMRAPSGQRDKPCVGYATRLCRTVANKGSRSPIYCATWLPETRMEGRYLITGSSSGEFTLWNGLMFKFETILQAHDTAVRAMVWTHNNDYMVTADHGGAIKYWEQSLNCCAKPIQASKDPIRSLSMCPTDVKFCTGSDDSLVKIWDFQTQKCERSLEGHGWDVKCVAWHPSRSIIASGSKDNVVKFWDPKSGDCLSSLHDHKNTIVKIEWNKNSNWLLTACRDEKIRLYDVRKMSQPGKSAPMRVYQGHTKEVTSIAWHPYHEDSFVSGDFIGTLNYWSVEKENPVETIEAAHDSGIWALAWHPAGHVLCTGSNDHTTRFWSRVRPGCSVTQQRSIYDENKGTAGGASTSSGYAKPKATNFESGGFGGKSSATAVIPGMSSAHAPAGISIHTSVPLTTSSLSRLENNRDKPDTVHKPPPDSYTCNICGIKGHWIQQCPQRNPDGGGGASSSFGNNDNSSSSKPPPGYICKKCNIPGHYVSDCPSQGIPPEGYICHQCKQPGHWRQNCPMNDASGPAVGNSTSTDGLPGPGYICHGCGKPGHWRQNCPLNGTVGNSAIGDIQHRPPPDSYTCKICNIKGHWIQQCPMKNAAGGGQQNSMHIARSVTGTNHVPLGTRRPHPSDSIGYLQQQPPNKMIRTGYSLPPHNGGAPLQMPPSWPPNTTRPPYPGNYPV